VDVCDGKVEKMEGLPIFDRFLIYKWVSDIVENQAM